jgi:four helix bundle protein
MSLKGTLFLALRKFDLEERLINFSVSIIELLKEIPKSYPGIHLSKQLARSGTSVALNYGEAQASESKKDFIHKMKIVLKELRETFICLKILLRTKLYRNKEKITLVYSECNELISIFVKSIETVNKNHNLK